MMRSYESSGISGYYLEPRTARYFRVVPIGSPLISLLNAARDEAASTDFNTDRRKNVYESTFPRYKSVINCLNDNQMGSLKSFSYQHEIAALKMKSLHLSHQFIYPSANMNLKIRLLRGGIENLYGQWVSPMKGTVFYAFSDFTDVNQPPVYEAYRFEIAYLGPRNIAVDMCEGFAHPLCVLYVCNDFYTGLGASRLTWRQEFHNDAAYGSQSFYVNSAIWCCCSNRFSGLFALGVENGIYVHNSDTYLYTKQFEGEVLGVHFNKTGEIIYAGINQGKLITVDTRIHNPVCETKLNDHALTEVTLLDNENFMLCAGLGNFLCQVDLRMQRKVVNYIGEFRNTLKNPFSFDETYNVLCSTGSDDITRLWSLRGGRPVKTVLPPIPGEECRSWLMCDPAAKLRLLLACKNMVYVHEY
ncbi:uncharacterized protein LOC129958383 [Argiope bruennichi]|uniref:uncharacterized protein LOC129958383 n=1 Tax=Argiope bruennichi TaxID=94029 RepID=UPI0024940C55|nr:uncharacterized protein LOC129958383 [Argiope bruennichi]